MPIHQSGPFCFRLPRRLIPMTTRTDRPQVAFVIAPELCLRSDVIDLRGPCHAAHLAQILVPLQDALAQFIPCAAITLGMSIAFVPVVSACVAIVVGVLMASAAAVSQPSTSGVSAWSWC